MIVIIIFVKGKFNMEIDNNTMKKIRELDGEELKRAINVIADVTNADPKQRDKILKNIKTVKKKLNSASEKDMQSAVKKMDIDEKTISDIISKLNLK